MTKKQKILTSSLVILILISGLAFTQSNLKESQDLRKSASESEPNKYIQLQAKPLPVDKTENTPRTIQVSLPESRDFGHPVPGIQVAFTAYSKSTQPPAVEFSDQIKSKYEEYFTKITPVENGYYIETIFLSDIESICNYICLQPHEWIDLVDLTFGPEDDQQDIRISFDKNRTISYSTSSNDLLNFFDTTNDLADIVLPDPNPVTVPTYDLILETITPFIKNANVGYSVGEIIEYGLNIENSTNASSNPVTVQSIDLDIISSQEGVTAANARPGSTCTNQGVVFPVVLHCNYKTVGAVLPLKIQIFGASPGDITLTNVLTVTDQDESNLETDKSNNTIELKTSVATPTTPEYDIADIAGGPNGGPDGSVDLADYTLLVSQLGNTGSPGFHPADIAGGENGGPDGSVDLADYTLLVGHLGR